MSVKKVCILGWLFLCHGKYSLTHDLKLQFYKYFIQPIVEYGFLVYGSISDSQLRPILILQKKILRIINNLLLTRLVLTCLLNQAIKQFMRCTWVRYSITYFSIFEILSKNAYPRHITWKQEGNRRPCFTMLKPVSLQKTQSSTKQSNCIKFLRNLVYGPLAQISSKI